MSTALEEAPVIFVQEPEVFPKWVQDIESGYSIVVDNFLRAHTAHQKADAILRDFYVGTIPLKADFGELNSFIQSVSDAIVRRCEEEFAPAGTRLTIDRDLVQSLVVKLSYSSKNPNGWLGDPYDFKPSQTYKVLADKYNNITRVTEIAAAQAAEELVDCIGLGAFNYTESNAHKRPEFHDENGSIKPFIQRFDALHRKTKKAVIYITSMTEGYSNRDGIIWNMDATNMAKRLVAALRNVHALIFQGVVKKSDGFFLFINTLEDAINRIHSGSGGVYPIGHDEEVEKYRFIFRKKSLEVHLTHDMHERIVNFLAQNLKKAK